MEINNKKLSRHYIYIIYFFTFALLGWIMETFYCAYVMGYFSKRGFLYGPICPIYGYGALILIIILSKYRKNSIKLFFSSVAIFTFFEYIVSFGLDALFVIKKHVNLILAKIPHKIQVTAISTVLVVFIADTVLSCIRYII